MAENQTALQTKGPAEGSLKWYLEKPEYQASFQRVLGQRAPQFCASLINIASSSQMLKDADPPSVIASGMIAATLDLPLSKALGFAWVVPYRDNRAGKTFAQFQMGFRGYIQLALRTGQYSAMNAGAVNAEALGPFNKVGERTIIWENLADPVEKPVGYFFAWEMINGFSKVVFWSIDKVKVHAERYSQNHKGHIAKGYPQGRDCRWCSDFDAMAMKTLISNSIRKWGIMSVEMTSSPLATALKFDQSLGAIDITAEPVYPDSTSGEDEEEPRQLEDGKKPTETLKERLREQKRLEKESDRLADEAHKAAQQPQDAPAAAKAQDSAEPANPQPAPKSAAQAPAVESDGDDGGAAAAQKAKSLLLDAYEGAKERGISEKVLKDKLENAFNHRLVSKIDEDDYAAATELLNGLGR